MKIDKKYKVLYIHTGLRIYRFKLFQLLSKKFDMDFFLTENPKLDKHVFEEYSRIYDNCELNITQANEIKTCPFDGFSFQLFKIPFMKYDIFIFTSSVSLPFLTLSPILKLMGKKVILFDELWRYPKEKLKYRLIYLYVKFIVNYCVKSVLVSGTKAKELYIDEYNYEKSNIFIAYNTTLDYEKIEDNTDVDKKVKNLLDNTTKKKRILFLARVIKVKGLDILIKAMQNVNKEYDLVIVGEGDALVDCKNLVAKLNLKNRIFFLGSCYSYESKYFYKYTDIYILPSKTRLKDNVQVESWGFTVNEAMSMQKPIVSTTSVGSAFDLIKNGYNGYIVKDKDSGELSQKINLIIENNQDNVMGKNSRKCLLSKCNYEQNIQAYESAINNVHKKS